MFLPVMSLPLVSVATLGMWVHSFLADVRSDVCPQIGNYEMWQMKKSVDLC